MLRRHAMKTLAFWLAGASFLDAAAPGHQHTPAPAPAPAPAAGAGSPRRPFIEMTDGTRLFVRDWGPLTGAPVLFLAPWAMTIDWFEYQMTYLASQGLRCIGYDRRGHGRSDEPGHGYEFDTLIADLAMLIERLDLPNIPLVGHSLGAGEAVRYLSRYGVSRVSRQMLIAPITPFALKTPDNPDGTERSVMEAGRLKLAHDRPGQIAQAASAFFAAD